MDQVLLGPVNRMVKTDGRHPADRADEDRDHIVLALMVGREAAEQKTDTLPKAAVKTAAMMNTHEAEASLPG